MMVSENSADPHAGRGRVAPMVLRIGSKVERNVGWVAASEIWPVNATIEDGDEPDDVGDRRGRRGHRVAGRATAAEVVGGALRPPKP